MAQEKFIGFSEFETQVKKNFPTIHFTRVQLKEKRKVFLVNSALGIVVEYNYATQGATYYRFSTPKELSAETLGKLFIHYAKTENAEMEELIRQFIHYQKGIAHLDSMVYVDIMELGFLEKDLKETFPMLNTHASYDKESENFNRAMAVYRKAMEKGINPIDAPFNNAFEFASNVVVAECKKLYYLYANKLESMGVPAKETFSGEYFDILFARKASAEYAKNVESAVAPNIMVGQMCVIGSDTLPQIINFGLIF